jgi:cell division protease FtsH
MSPRLGPLSFGRNGFRSADGRPLFPGERPDISEETARVVDEEVARLVNEARDRALEILGNERDLLDKLSKVLIEREVIEGGELRRYVDGDLPIPTVEELRQEAEKKAEENGQKAEEDGRKRTKDLTGPDIIASAPPESVPTEEIPARPD